MSSSRNLPLRKGRAQRAPQHSLPLPTEPGLYYWDEWKEIVNVYRNGNGALWVLPPGRGAVPVKITPKIAGNFRPSTGWMSE